MSSSIRRNLELSNFSRFSISCLFYQMSLALIGCRKSRRFNLNNIEKLYPMHFFLLALLHNRETLPPIFSIRVFKYSNDSKFLLFIFFLHLLNKIHRWENAYENFLIHGIAIESGNWISSFAFHNSFALSHDGKNRGAFGDPVNLSLVFECERPTTRTKK